MIKFVRPLGYRNGWRPLRIALRYWRPKRLTLKGNPRIHAWLWWNF